MYLGKVFDPYETEPKDITGYELKTTPDNAKGELTEDPTEVVYVYTLKEAKLITKYVDKEGNPLKEDTEEITKWFSKYDTDELTFDGYKIYKIPDNKEGTIESSEVVVTYIYEKIEAPKDTPKDTPKDSPKAKTEDKKTVKDPAKPISKPIKPEAKAPIKKAHIIKTGDGFELGVVILLALSAISIIAIRLRKVRR